MNTELFTNEQALEAITALLQHDFENKQLQKLGSIAGGPSVYFPLNLMTIIERSEWGQDKNLFPVT